MVLFIPKKAIYACALAVVLVTAAALAPRPSPEVPAAAPAAPAVSRTTPVLDAGHGGEDGGAVSDSGVAESGINLQITRRLYEILPLSGASVGDDPQRRRRHLRRYRRHPAGEEGLRPEEPHGAGQRDAGRDCSSASTRTVCPAIPASGARRCFTTQSSRPSRLAETVQQALNSTVNGGKRQGRQAHRRRGVPHVPHHLPRHSGGVRLPVQPGGDGASAAAGLSGESSPPSLRRPTANTIRMREQHESKNGFFLHGVRQREPQVVGPLRRLRRVELHGGAAGGAPCQKRQDTAHRRRCKGVSHYIFAGG